MNTHRQNVEDRQGRLGFTMTEIMVAVAVFSLVIAAVVPAYVMCQRSWALTSVQLQAAQKASVAIEWLVYGVGKQYGLRSAISTTVVVTVAAPNWSVAYLDIGGGSNAFSYNSANKRLLYDGPSTSNSVVVGDCITRASVTNFANGMSISVTAGVTEGRYSATNTMTTFVAYRN